MPKQGLAVVTMCYNEPDFLPIWLDYYRRQVPVEHLYVVDHGSDDGSTSVIPSLRHRKFQREYPSV